MSSISLQYQQLNRLFPFFVLVNEQMQVQHCGASIQKLIALQEGNTFFGAFTVSRPFIKNNSAASLHQICNQVVILATNKLNIKLKGQFEYLAETNCFLFIGSPWFNSMDEVVDHQLTVNDFAHHDTLIDLLHILKEYESTNIEIRQLLNKVNEQSSELKKLSLIAEETINGIIITNRLGQIEWVNKAFERISGYTLSQVKGKSPGSFLQGPQTNTETVAYLRNQIRNGLHFSCEIINYSKNGHPYWTRITGQPILDQNGNVTQFFAMQEDITDKITAIQKLEKQRKFYEDVLNELPADIAVFNHKHEYLFVNPIAIKNPELRTWIIGKRDEDFCLYRNRPLSLAADRRKLFNDVADSRQQKEWEETMTAPDGSVQHLLRKMYPVYDEAGNLTFMIGYGVNITERKKSEEKIQQSEKRYRDLFNFSQALICTHDLSGKVLAVNPAICERLNYAQEDLLGLNIMDLMPEDSKPFFHSDYLDLVINNGKHKGVFSIYNKNKEEIFLLYQNFKVEETGEEPYIIGFSQDITDRIKAEKELNIAKKAAEDAGKSKQVFLANMSHEIRTPMTGILGIAELLNKTTQTKQQKEYTHLIIESTNTLLHIINDVLDIAKIEAGKFDFEEIPFNLVHKVNNVIKAFSFKAEEKGIVLQFINKVDSGKVVAGDPHRLIQVLNNLINNALKFTHQGSVIVYLEAVEQQNTTPFTTTYQFKVTDTGIGISPESQSKIFDAFVQATADTTRKFGGTGLGLAICKQLIEQQGGSIQLSSVLNVGSTFTFSLTYKNVDDEELGHPSSAASAAQALLNNKHTGKCILIAEDVKLNQMIAKSILESWQHTVEIANNGLEALQMASAKLYDLILMDVHMPEMDGIAATQKIRQLGDAKLRNVPIVALTASAFKSDTKRFIEAGMNTYITKPYTQLKLLECINAVFDNGIASSGTSNPIARPAADPRHEEATLKAASQPNYSIQEIEALDADAEFIKEMIGVFVEQVTEDLRDLDTAVQAADWNNVYKIAHKLKPSVTSFQMQTAIPLVMQIELMAKRNENVQNIPTLVQQLQQLLTNIVQHMQQHYL
jgi:PAS domain S-box-containing protein